MLEAIIFDMDGVVIDSHPAHCEAWRMLLCSVGKDPDKLDLSFILDGRKRDDILRHYLGQDLTREELAMYGKRKDDFFVARLDEVPLVGGFPGFLQALENSGIGAAIATSASRERTLNVLQSLGLLRRFQAVVTGDDILQGKPDPAVFQTAAQKLNAAPHRVLVFEDAVSGVKAAVRARMKCLGIATGQRARLLMEAGASRTIANYCDISLADLGSMLTARVARG